jgi:rhodanese-related sulfurtransferase
VVQQMHVQELAALLQGGEPVFLVDVRQPWEHETAALPGSVLAPLDQLPRQARELSPPEGAKIVVYCHHGIRSLSGAALLQHLGFHNVVSLAGGIDAWSLLVDPRVPRY